MSEHTMEPEKEIAALRAQVEEYREALDKIRNLTYYQAYLGMHRRIANTALAATGKE